MIKDLATYERAPEAVDATEAMVADLLFGGTTSTSGLPACFAHVVEHEAATSGYRLGGFALWNLKVSTWRGRYGIYLEDLYVRPELRGLGYGSALMQTLIDECAKKGYPRFEWSVLDWNEPSIAFYRSLGATPLEEWTTWRLEVPLEG